MTRRALLARLDTARVEESIRQAEKRAAIELRVSVAGPFWGSCQRLAERAFLRMGMANTRGRNGVLLLLAPWRRTVVIVPDRGITVDAALWTQTLALVTGAFRDGRFTEGLEAAIAQLATGLAARYPAANNAAPGELSDTVDRGS